MAKLDKNASLIRKRRAEAIRLWCRGSGLLNDRINNVDVTDEQLELFCMEEREDLIALLNRALDFLPVDQLGAMRNALGKNYYLAVKDPGSLADRRSFYAQTRRISPRTLIRYEAAGALTMADFVVKLQDVGPSKADLEARVADLETMVFHLNHALIILDMHLRGELRPSLDGFSLRKVLEGVGLKADPQAKERYEQTFERLEFEYLRTVNARQGEAKSSKESE